jgi:hypothetical protein
MTDMPEKIWAIGEVPTPLGVAGKFAPFESCAGGETPYIRADLARAPDPLLEKMVKVLHGVLEGEYITQEMEQQARAVLAEHEAREGGE